MLITAVCIKLKHKIIAFIRGQNTDYKTLGSFNHFTTDNSRYSIFLNF